VTFPGGGFNDNRSGRAFQLPCGRLISPVPPDSGKNGAYSVRKLLSGHIQLWIRRTLIAAGKPPMDELLRIVAAVGITLAVAALAVMFFMWVFS
jgi:hypothetical protein